MLCDICHAKEATVHLTEVINDKITKLHLCEDCAKEKSQEMEMHFDLSDLLAGLAEVNDVQEQVVDKGVRCDFCGSSWTDFQKTGRLGCPKCYEIFERQLAPLLRRIHGQDKHMGKMPIKTAAGKVTKEATDLQELKAKLQKAISMEAFEEAAKLRDKIREMESKLKPKSKG